jgi:hypothetical protein
MKVSRMTSRDRRAITLGAAILLPSLFFIWGVKPYFAALSDARQQLSVEREALARERTAIAAAHRNPQLQHNADAAMRAMTPRLFEGRDDVMASAELASYIADVARQNRVWLQDAATRPAVQAPGGVRTLRVEMRAESDLRGVLAMLHALETGQKLVRIDRLDISRMTKAASEDGTETLAVSATIVAFALGTVAPTALPAGATTPKKATQ